MVISEIKYNDTDSCIRFTLSKNHKKFIVTIDDTLANNLSATIDMNKTNVYNSVSYTHLRAHET